MKTKVVMHSDGSMEEFKVCNFCGEPLEDAKIAWDNDASDEELRNAKVIGHATVIPEVGYSCLRRFHNECYFEVYDPQS